MNTDKKKTLIKKKRIIKKQTNFNNTQIKKSE